MANQLRRTEGSARRLPHILNPVKEPVAVRPKSADDSASHDDPGASGRFQLPEQTRDIDVRGRLGAHGGVRPSRANTGADVEPTTVDVRGRRSGGNYVVAMRR